jgi:hypothetical protein
MYFLRITSLVFAFGFWVARLLAVPAETVRTNGDNDKIRSFQIAPFDKIELEGTFIVVLEQGANEGLRVKTDDDRFDDIELDSDASTGRLKIVRKHFSFHEITLYVTFRTLRQLSVQGGIILKTNGYVDLPNFDLHVSGGACVAMKLKAEQLNVTGEGGVKFEFIGIAGQLNAKISGTGYMNALELKARKVDFRIEGVGAGTVYATDSLSAAIGGIGKIRYRGNPQVFRKIEGIGMISQE